MPAQEADEGAAAAQCEPVTEHVEPRAAGASATETILLVEDEQALRELTARILSGAGYTVIAAGSGAEALDLARQHGASIDLLLTDVILPGMDGHALLLALGADFPGLKTLFMSGYIGTFTAVHGEDEKGAHLLGKPFTARQLTQKIREILDSQP